MIAVYVFMDESGNLGFQFHRGSTRYFVIVFLLTKDPWALRDRIAALRAQLSLPAIFEFNYHGTGRIVKAAFFQAISLLSFEVRAVVIDKRTLPPSFRRMNRQAFYNFFVGELAQRVPDETLTDGALTIDGLTKSKEFVRRLRKHLSTLVQERGTKRKFKQIRGIDSRQDDTIQCADMLAGVIGEEFFGGGSIYFPLIKSKITDLWRYP